uniref:Uncharacterized protein n=1 Tax=Anguilla anguilla TaxID=7936 RepID=A0A0E9S7X3_ANGAN
MVCKLSGAGVLQGQRTMQRGRVWSGLGHSRELWGRVLRLLLTMCHMYIGARELRQIRVLVVSTVGSQSTGHKD